MFTTVLLINTGKENTLGLIKPLTRKQMTYQTNPVFKGRLKYISLFTQLFSLITIQDPKVNP